MVSNADLILTKNHILQKVNHLLATLQTKQQHHLESFSVQLPGQAISSSPKISKGENYKGLPYLILDYPRFFEKENICAIRTMFWWGNFISVTLHLSGIYKQETEEKLIKLYPNPAVAYVTFDIQKDISKGYSIQIYNFLGKKMNETQNIIQKTTVLLDEFNRGVYIYHLRDQNGKIIESGKFQVSK